VNVGLETESFLAQSQSNTVAEIAMGMSRRDILGHLLGGVSGGARFSEADLPDFLRTLEVACEAGEKLEPPVGFEPTTYALRTTTEVVSALSRMQTLV